MVSNRKHCVLVRTNQYLQVTGVIRNKPVILAINGEGGASQIYVITAEYSDPTGSPLPIQIQAHPRINVRFSSLVCASGRIVHILYM